MSQRLLAYDTTNFHTYIASTNTRSALAQRGHNKQCRHNLRQVGLSYVMVATLRRLKTTSVEQYRKLFGAASYPRNKREIKLAAVLIDDTREGFPRLRYCDVAAAAIQRLSGQDFGVTQNMTRPDWDRAVSRARDWLARQ